MKEKRKKAEEPPEEIDATFTDETGERWRPRLSLKIVDRFCRETGAPSMDLFSVSAAEVMDLVYAGIQYQTLYIDSPFSREEFLERLDGPAYEAALAAGRNAIANFILRCRLPSMKRADAVKYMRAFLANPDQGVEKSGDVLLAMLARLAAEAGKVAAPGPGPMLSSSPESPEPTPQAPV